MGITQIGLIIGILGVIIGILVFIIGNLGVIIAIFPEVGHWIRRSLQRIWLYLTGKGRKVFIFFLIAIVVIAIIYIPRTYEVSFNLIGTYDTSSEINGIFVANNTAYIATEKDGLLILDVSMPDKPRKIGRYEGESRVENVVVDRERAYVIEETKLILLDVKIPNFPKKIGEYKGEDNLGGELDVIGNIVYTVNSEKLTLIDVSNQSNPAKIGEFVFGMSNLVSCDIDVVDGIAYVAGGTGGLHIIDARIPSKPVQIGSFDTAGWAAKIIVDRNTAYITMWKEGLFIVDVRQPSHPIRLAYYRSEVRELGQDVFIDLAVLNNTAWVTYLTGIEFTPTGYSPIGSGVMAINLKELNSPQKMGEFHGLSKARGVFAVEDLLYLADGTKLSIFKPEFKRIWFKEKGRKVEKTLFMSLNWR